MSRVKLVLSIVVLSLFFMIVVNYPNTITLELGVFSGSNWGVPSGESYKIIDGAIERFKTGVARDELWRFTASLINHFHSI